MDDPLTKRVNGREFVRDRRGAMRLTRRWDPARGEWAFTDQGQRLYEHEQSRFIINIPAYIHFYPKKDADGRYCGTETAT